MTPTDRDALLRQLDPAYDEEQIAETWARIEAARHPQRAARRWMAAGALALAAAAVIALVATRAQLPSPPGPLASQDPAVTLRPGTRVDATAAPRALALDDGSRLQLEEDACLEVLSNDGGRFVTQLTRGRATFDVRPGGRRQWAIETALATVEVVGTAFSVESRADRVIVAVQRGVVMVRGERVPGRVARLTAGQRLEVPRTAAALFDAPPQPAKPAPTPTTPTTVLAAPVTGPALPATAAAAPSPAAPKRRPEPLGAARDLGPAPATGPTVRSLPDALAEADRLRSWGDPAAAATQLEAALAQQPKDPGAGLAAFTLGRLALDTLHQPQRAARAFALVIAIGTPQSLCEDAHVRRAEALIVAKDRAAAAAAIEQYERAYPTGRRGPGLRARLAQLPPTP